MEPSGVEGIDLWLSLSARYAATRAGQDICAVTNDWWPTTAHQILGVLAKLKCTNRLIANLVGDKMYVLYQGLSQDLETNCQKLPIANFGGILSFREMTKYSDYNHQHVLIYWNKAWYPNTMLRNLYWSDILIQCWGIYIGLKKNQLHVWNWHFKKFQVNILHLLRADFWGFGCPNDSQTPPPPPPPPPPKKNSGNRKEGLENQGPSLFSTIPLPINTDDIRVILIHVVRHVFTIYIYIKPWYGSSIAVYRYTLLLPAFSIQPIPLPCLSILDWSVLLYNSHPVIDIGIGYIDDHSEGTARIKKLGDRNWKCHGNYTTTKKFNYMFNVDILRNPSQGKFGCPGGDLWGFFYHRAGDFVQGVKYIRKLKAHYLT